LDLLQEPALTLRARPRIHPDDSGLDGKNSEASSTAVASTARSTSMDPLQQAYLPDELPPPHNATSTSTSGKRRRSPGSAIPSWCEIVDRTGWRAAAGWRELDGRS